MERDPWKFWFREHPTKGWQMWNGDAETDRWYAHRSKLAPGADPLDVILDYDATKDEPEAD